MTITELKEQLIKLEDKGFGNKKVILDVSDKFGNYLEAEFTMDNNNKNLSDICNRETLLGFMFGLRCKDNYWGSCDNKTVPNIRHLKSK